MTVETMPVVEARVMMAETLGAYVKAASAADRHATHEKYVLMRLAFRKTYGEEEWRRSFDQALDEGQLESFVYDREALRDG